ncbi:MAG: glycosyltransferase family 4 protein [Candidatus Hodarchaeota archaeon]
MNILYFAHYFPPHSGAAAICTHKISAYLAKFGHNILVLAPENKGKFFKGKASRVFNNIEVINSNQIVRFPFSLIISHIENLIKFLTKLKANFRPDIIFSQYHTFHYASVVGGYLSKILKIPHIIRSHDIFIDLKTKSVPFKIIFSINYPRIYHSICNCDIDYVQTSEMKEYLSKFRKFKDVSFRILHNGIETQQFYPHRNQDFFKDKYGCDIIVSFIGLMTQDIGIHNFIQILPEVLKTHKDTHLLMIGDGPYKNFVLKLVKKLQLNKKVHFLGIRPHHEIPFFINNCDIGIGRITHKEMWRYFIPVKCLEYMACQKPFITTPISRDAIKNNDVGLILKRDFNNKELVTKLIMLIEDKSLRTKLGENGLKKINQNFKWEAIMEDFNTDLEEIK